ncbi:RNase MRP [Schizosaccharomyces japonicus yFS275]|uniref:RNase MRP n=1 Tax=Schizosaccharomyces japonicus (strain yFS275 / FY16936) TaxID=402676 RepID=B6K0J1_SCHJY|nr:RNase MRP [Schizosaccharomyces japonicus yFS275]EEB07462.1 RNase MRP [Schizosaccharomyces japonicus yFS275]
MQRAQYLLNAAAFLRSQDVTLSNDYVLKMYDILDEENQEKAPEMMKIACRSCGSLLVAGANCSTRTRSTTRKHRTDLKPSEKARMQAQLLVQCFTCQRTTASPLDAPPRLRRSKLVPPPKAATPLPMPGASARNAKNRQRHRLRAAGLAGMLAKKGGIKGVTKSSKQASSSSASLSLSDFLSTT